MFQIFFSRYCFPLLFCYVAYDKVLHFLIFSYSLFYFLPICVHSVCSLSMEDPDKYVH